MSKLLYIEADKLEEIFNDLRYHYAKVSKDEYMIGAMQAMQAVAIVIKSQMKPVEPLFDGIKNIAFGNGSSQEKLQELKELFSRHQNNNSSKI